MFISIRLCRKVSIDRRILFSFCGLMKSPVYDLHQIGNNLIAEVFCRILKMFFVFDFEDDLEP